MQRLASHPVLFREVAAELGKDDATIARAAINALGVEVATDGQAKALDNGPGMRDTRCRGMTRYHCWNASENGTA